MATVINSIRQPTPLSHNTQTWIWPCSWSR